MDFDEYSGHLYTRKAREAQRWVDGRTPIPFLEVLALRIMWALEFEHVSFDRSNEHQFAFDLLIKTVHEIRCLVACARAGSSYGTFSHARGVLECAAMAYYVFGSGPTEAHRGALRWVTYRKAASYLHRRHLELCRDRGDVDDAEFTERCVAGPEATEVSQDDFCIWESTFQKKSGWFQRRAERSGNMDPWFAPATYTGLIEAMVDDSSQTTARLSDAYRFFCQATHLTPLSSGIAGKGTLVRVDDRRMYHYESLTVYRAFDVMIDLLPAPIRSGVAKATEQERYQLVTVGLGLKLQIQSDHPAISE